MAMTAMCLLPRACLALADVKTAWATSAISQLVTSSSTSVSSCLTRNIYAMRHDIVRQKTTEQTCCLANSYRLISDTANYVKIVCRVVSKSLASWQQVCSVTVMEFGKQHDTTYFCLHQLVTDCCLCCRLVTHLSVNKTTNCYGLATGKLV